MPNIINRWLRYYCTLRQANNRCKSVYIAWRLVRTASDKMPDLSLASPKQTWWWRLVGKKSDVLQVQEFAGPFRVSESTPEDWREFGEVAIRYMAQEVGAKESSVPHQASPEPPGPPDPPDGWSEEARIAMMRQMEKDWYGKSIILTNRNGQSVRYTWGTVGDDKRLIQEKDNE